MKRFTPFTAILSIVALGVPLLVPAEAEAADPLTCEGYPEPRHFVESQSWWKVEPGQTGTDHGHVHVGACIPEREVISQPITLDVRLILHDNGLTKVYSVGSSNRPYVSLVLKGRSYETTVEKDFFAGWSSPVGTSTRWTQMTLNPSQFGASGLQEVRFRFFLDVLDRSATGSTVTNRMSASLNWQLYVQNGKTLSNVTRQPYVRGKGWYTGSGYCESGFTSVPLPDFPVPAPWTPSLRMVDHGTADVDPKHYVVSVDPDAHADPPVPGTIVQEGVTYEGPVTVDTASLAPGRHRLVTRTECPDARGTNAGVLVVPFDVARTP